MMASTTSDLSAKEKKSWQEFEAICKRIHTATEAPINESPKEKQKRIALLTEKSVEGFTRFCHYYFPDYIDGEFGWFHKKGIDNILKRKSFNIWEWPREHAKSVVADIFAPMWLYAEEWLDGMILASETEDKGNILIRDVQAQLSSNQRFINDFGKNHIIGSWNSGHFSTTKGIGFWAFGLGQNPAGTREGHRRPNLGIIDDASSKKKARNQELVKEDVDWVLGEFMGCLQMKNHIFIYANNRVAKNDLTAHMVGDIEPDMPKREGIAHIKVYATEDSKHNMLMPAEGGKPAWPRFTVKHIQDRINAMGYRNAMRQLYHMHIEDGNVFKPEDTVWVDPRPLHEYESLVAYCDPSFSDSKKSDYKAIVLLGLKGKFIDVLWAWIRQATPAAMISAYFELKIMIDGGSPTFYDHQSNVAFREVVCRYYFEGSFAQKLVFKPMFDAEGESRDLYWQPRFDDRQKPNKQGRIEAMSTDWELGLMRFNRKMKKNKDFITLLDQFYAFYSPNAKDDGPDAVEGGKFYLQKSKRGKKSNPRQGRYTKNKKRQG